MTRDDIPGLIIIGVAFLLLVTLVFLFVRIVTDGPDPRWDTYRQHCQEASGHIYQPADYAWCLTNDGKVIEVYP